MSVGEVILNNSNESIEQLTGDTPENDCAEEVHNAPQGSNVPAQQDAAASKKEIKCLKCGKTFTAVSSLKRHVNIYHMQDQNHQCNVCDQEWVKHVNYYTLNSIMSFLTLQNIFGPGGIIPFRSILLCQSYGF